MNKKHPRKNTKSFLKKLGALDERSYRYPALIIAIGIFFILTIIFIINNTVS